MDRRQTRGQLPEPDVRESKQQDRHEPEQSQNLNKAGNVKRPMK